MNTRQPALNSQKPDMIPTALLRAMFGAWLWSTAWMNSFAG